MTCRSSWHRLAALNAVIVIALAVQGCTPVSESVPLRGVVTLDGKPLPCGVIQFQPATGQPASGEIAADGTFTLSRNAPADGVPPGTYRVSVLAYDPQAATYSDEHLLIPLKYTRFGTSGIEFTVFPGSVDPVVINLASDEAAGSSPAKGVDGDHSAATGSDS